MINPNVVYFLLVLILLIGFLNRLPYNNFPIDEDFGICTYPAYFRDKGIKIVRDYWGGFPLTLFHIYIFVQKVFGSSIKHVRRFSNYYNLLNAFAIFLVTDYLFGSSEALAAALIYALFSASPYLGTYSCHAEGFYSLPLILGILSVAYGTSENQTIYFMVGGIFIAIAFIFKLVNIVYWFSFSTYLLFLQLYKETVFFSFSFIVAAALYTLIITFVYRGWNQQLWHQNQIRYRVTLNFINTNLKNNYKSDFPPVWQETGSIFLLSSLFLGYLLTIERSIAENILVVWTISTLIILVSQRVYLMYHFIPVVQSASILSGLALHKLSETYAHYPYYYSLPVILLFITLLALNIYRKFNYLILYKRDKRLPFFQKADQFFYIPEIARYVRENTSSDDYIYAWGPFIQIYRLADRKSCDGYAFHFVRPYKKWNVFLFDEILNGIISKKPAYIVLIRPDFDMKVLEQITGFEYALERVFFNLYPVYRLKGKISEPLKINNMTWREKIRWLELLTPGQMDYKIDETYVKRGLYDKAMDEYEKALKLNPNDFLTKFGIASLMRAIGKYEEALTWYQKIEELDSTREWLHLEKGLTYGKMGKYDEAIQELKVEEYLFPCKAETSHGTGVVFNYQKKYEDALKMFQKAIDSKPLMEWVHLDRGLTYGEIGKYDEAVRELQIEERLFPGKAVTKSALGVIFKNQKKYDSAIKAFQEALTINPSSLLTKYNLYAVLEAMRRYQEAKNGFLEIISNDSISTCFKGGCSFHLGKIFFFEDDLINAKRFLKKCLELIPGHREASQHLNMIASNAETL